MQEIVICLIWHGAHDVLILPTSSDPEADITITRHIGQGKE
jgi:hypothetical protein